MAETRYNGDDIKILMDIYLKYAEVGKGISYSRFKDFIGYLYNIENHPFCDKLFLYFDKNQDLLVEFSEVVRSLDIIEKGNFDEKIELCFSIYDIYNNSFLDIYTLRKVLKISYVKMLINIENIINKIQNLTTKNPLGIDWMEFSDPENELLIPLAETLPTVFDRFDYYRSLINYLEVKYKFTLESLEQLWNIYKVIRLDSHIYINIGSEEE